ncbi:MAG: putative DNA binding domain-containing protein [Anaerolineae bacterium]|nr:putative DNA binding domain-containing protein [Anaerolineae bacterium]MDW8173783.1 ATP-binding protein [Anaerolineae bacterium]
MLTIEQIKHGTGSRLAFVEKADAKKIAETTLAFANTEGGIIVLGLTEKGKPSSSKIRVDQIQQLLKTLDEMISPPVVIDHWEELIFDDDEFEESSTPSEDVSNVLDLTSLTATLPPVAPRDLFELVERLKQAKPCDDQVKLGSKQLKPADDQVKFINEQPKLVEDRPPKPRQTVHLYAIRVPRSIELHALTDGRVLIRSGARNRPLGGQEILRLASAKSTGDFEAEVVPGAAREDFSKKMLNEYLEKRAERTKRPFQGSVDDLLREIGALTPDGRPTVTGILLFAEYPQQWIPQSSVVFAKFVGKTPRGENGLAGYSRREEITGPLPRLIEASWNFVWSEMAVSAVVKGLEREERAEYPQFAVREAIVNSICHRDYRLRGRRIEIRMYSDRLEVISPGGLPGFITVENIKDEHFSRNPRIVNGLFQWGYIEELGLGIDRMIEVMEQAGQQPPVFDARPYSFAVTLYNERGKPKAPEWVRSNNYRQARALQYIREHGSISNREYRALCEGVSAETLRLDLADMVEKGVLVRVGSKKGTHYILK